MTTVDDFLITLPDGRIAGGIKMANGTNSLRTPGGALPGTRARSASLVQITSFSQLYEPPADCIVPFGE